MSVQAFWCNDKGERLEGSLSFPLHNIFNICVKLSSQGLTSQQLSVATAAPTSTTQTVAPTSTPPTSAPLVYDYGTGHGRQLGVSSSPVSSSPVSSSQPKLIDLKDVVLRQGDLSESIIKGIETVNESVSKYCKDNMCHLQATLKEFWFSTAIGTIDVVGTAVLQETSQNELVAQTTAAPTSTPFVIDTSGYHTRRVLGGSFNQRSPKSSAWVPIQPTKRYLTIGPEFNVTLKLATYESKKASSNTGAILGSLLGIIAFLCFLPILFRLLRKRRERNADLKVKKTLESDRYTNDYENGGTNDLVTTEVDMGTETVSKDVAPMSFGHEKGLNDVSPPGSLYDIVMAKKSGHRKKELL